MLILTGMKSLNEDAGRREAQKKLAEEVVRDLHGEEGLESALKIMDVTKRYTIISAKKKSR